jgi:hypothetical protein
MPSVLKDRREHRSSAVGERMGSADALDGLLSKRNTSADVFADSAYRSTEIQVAARSQRLLGPIFIGTPRANPAAFSNAR